MIELLALSKYDLDSDPAIVTIASIVRGADTNRHDLTPQSAGLLVILARTITRCIDLAQVPSWQGQDADMNSP